VQQTAAPGTTRAIKSQKNYRKLNLLARNFTPSTIRDSVAQQALISQFARSGLTKLSACNQAEMNEVERPIESAQ
jgi:hypothetical protein